MIAHISLYIYVSVLINISINGFDSFQLLVIYFETWFIETWFILQICNRHLQCIDLILMHF